MKTTSWYAGQVNPHAGICRQAGGGTVVDRYPRLITQQIVNVVGPALTARLCDFRMRVGAHNAGYPHIAEWHPDVPAGWGTFPPCPMKRSVIYRGDAATWSYSHHQAIVKIGDRYVASWSNGLVHEDHPGQEVHVATSTDCRTWSTPAVIAHTPAATGIVRNNSGLYATHDRLYAYVGVMTDPGEDTATPGMTCFAQPTFSLDIYATDDLTHWAHHASVCEHIYLFEGPRLTHGGRLICCGSDERDNHAVILVWDAMADPTSSPRMIHIPPSPAGVVPTQGTWYQTDNGRIWMYVRNGGVSSRLGLTWSDDEGDTWSPLHLTDFPNTFSRAHAGRLTDGRCYIVGNNYDVFLDRRRLLMALSDDGYTFDRQYSLLEGATTRRINGLHKEDGYHYPSTFVEGDRLIVIYSVNKEDIEVGIVDMRALLEETV